MNVRCPKCKVRYRLDDSRLAGDTTKLKCPKCLAIFLVRKPVEPSGEEEVTMATLSPAPRPGSPSPAISSGPRSALLADEPREFRDFVASVLKAAGFEVGVTDNGDEALLLAVSHRFDLILLNVYLRRMLGINVSERIKNNPALRDTPVILIGAPIRQEEGGLPVGLYGADDFISTSISQDELSQKIRRWSPGSPVPIQMSPSAPAASTPAHFEPEGNGSEGEIRRLARIMVSDIQMYHPEKFNRALREGTFFEAFSEELGKGKGIIDHRFAEVPNRIQLLAAGIRDTLASLRPNASRGRVAGE